MNRFAVANSVADRRRQERAVICVWAAKASNDAELIRSIDAVCARPSCSFEGNISVYEKFRDKTTLVLTGVGAHHAARHLISGRVQLGPQQKRQWKNVSENTKIWSCPQRSCVSQPLNDYRDRSHCRHCGSAKPKNLQASEIIWRDQFDMSDANAAASSNQTNESSASVTSTHNQQNNHKRPHLQTIDLSSHPNVDDEKVRFTIWLPIHLENDDALLADIRRHCPNFSGNIYVTDKYCGKAVVTLVGAGCHSAAARLEQIRPPSGNPWKNVSGHHREWFCPRLSCLMRTLPNLDDHGEAAARCQGCGGGRPHKFVEAEEIWRSELAESLQNDSSAMIMNAGTSNHNYRSGGNGGAVPTVSPTNNDSTYDSTAAALTHAQPPPPSLPPRQPTAAGEFGIWQTAIATAGMSPSTMLSENKLFLSKTKDNVKALLTTSNKSTSRLFAFDTNPNNGAKGWGFAADVDSFVDAYLAIDPSRRHAYEVIGEGVPCRIAYDLDMYMYTGDGVNAGKNDVAMAGAIIKKTHRIIEEHWPYDNQPTFQDEVLVAHGPKKRSYHIIIRMYQDSTEVLLKDFQASKTLAHEVNDDLGETILVDRKAGHGGQSNPEPTSFIDLSIYTKDRPFRLILSSKITSPDRPFVDGQRGPFDFRGRDEKAAIIDTLVVPPASTKDAYAIVDLFPEPTPGPITIGALTAEVGSPPNNENITENSSISRSIDSSDLPLLDYGRGKVASKILGRDVPRPFNRLQPWIHELATALPNAAKQGQVISEARYEYSDNEAYVHFTLNRRFASHCHNIGRAHQQNNIMISVDLFHGIAYQRCWDSSCRDSASKASARSMISSSPPTGALPTEDELKEYDRTGQLSIC